METEHNDSQNDESNGQNENDEGHLENLGLAHRIANGPKEPIRRLSSGLCGTSVPFYTPSCYN